MELKGERTIPAPRERTWAALNDPTVLKACITGCESLEREGDNGLLALVAVKVGPVSARFKGKLQLADVVPQQSYTIHFDGQGGVAGFGKGSADVSCPMPDRAAQPWPTWPVPRSAASWLRSARAWSTPRLPRSPRTSSRPSRRSFAPKRALCLRPRRKLPRRPVWTVPFVGSAGPCGQQRPSFGAIIVYLATR
jgi:hypothetical protein